MTDIIYHMEHYLSFDIKDGADHKWRYRYIQMKDSIGLGWKQNWRGLKILLYFAKLLRILKSKQIASGLKEVKKM